MSTSDKRSAKLEQIRALFKMTVENGCTEAEAQTAFLRAQELMQKWDVHTKEVEFVEYEDEPVIVGRSLHNVARAQWSKMLAEAIARNFRCKQYLRLVPEIITGKVDGRKRRGVYIPELGRWFRPGETYSYETTERSRTVSYQFIGEKSDAEMAAFLFDQAVNAGRLLADEYADTQVYYKGCGMTREQTSAAYLEGFAQGLYDAFEEQYTKSCETALVIVRDRSARVNTFIDQNFRFSGVSIERSQRHADGGAYNSGHVDGGAFGSQQKQTRGGRGSSPHRTTRGYLS